MSHYSSYLPPNIPKFCFKQPSYEIEHTDPNNHLNSIKVSRNEPCPCGSGKKYTSGYLSAGALAAIIAEIINGKDVRQAAEIAISFLKTYEGHKECLDAMQRAIDLSAQNVDPSEAVSQLGEGWIGEEALAIALYCALMHQNDFKKAVTLAVNHSGDSDSTGAICGNILGAYLGIQSVEGMGGIEGVEGTEGIQGIPTNWINNVELSELITSMADKLLDATK